MKGHALNRYIRLAAVFLVGLLLSQACQLDQPPFQQTEQKAFSSESSGIISPTLSRPNSRRNTALEVASTQALEPPKNPFLANSPWPTYHRNTYAQASTPLRGIESGDAVEVDVLRTNLSSTSPWTQLSEKYETGERVAWGATTTHVFKTSFLGETFEVIDSYRIDFNPLTNHWAIVLLAGNKAIVPDPPKRKLYRFADADPTNFQSPIQREAVFEFPDSIPGKSAHLSVAYDGWIIFTTGAGYIGAVSPDFSQYRSLQLPQNNGEVNYHNSFALDETGGIYIVTTDRMLRVNWQNTEFSLAWNVPYNFRGPGCEGISRTAAAEFFAFLRGETCTGSGTTPTLMGLDGQDELVLVADGHSPSNNMVAFWRNAIPDDWVGLPGYDRRIAAVTPLPYSTPDGKGFTAENSPTAWGYEIAIAQYNGFSPGVNPVTGVQKLKWNPDTRTLDVIWATDAVNFNNVMTYSVGSNLVYGTGRRDSIYYFWGLNWDTGEIVVKIPLGNSDDYLDQGNQVTIAENRTILYGSARGIVRLRPKS